MMIKTKVKIVKTSVKLTKNIENDETHFNIIFTFQCFTIQTTHISGIFI